MNYSNKSFETFQNLILKHFSEDSLMWRVRDGLFAEAYYGKTSVLGKLSRIPMGWIPALLVHFLRARRLFRRSSFSSAQAPAETTHFLFLSARNNHINRLAPLFQTEIDQGIQCKAWSSVFDLPQQIFSSPPDQIAGAWTAHHQRRDVLVARRLVHKLRRAIPEHLNTEKLAAIRCYLIEFFAWRRFWLKAFENRPRCVISSFEKSPMAKAFFYSAWELEIPERIHWVHGLRHASLQSTLATKLWCMTPGDVRFLKTLVPSFCTPSVMENPEAEALARAIGKTNLSSIQENVPLHFLFLGPGREDSYTKSMRMVDLSVIRTIQTHFGDSISWRFRPHPSAVERFRLELAESQIQVSDFSTRPLYDDLKWSQAVGSSWSSLLLDIRQTGRLIFWVQAEIRSLGAVDELIEDAIGIHVDCNTGPQKLHRILPHL